MAKYRIIRRNPATGETTLWGSNDHRGVVRAARYDHKYRGYHVTVVRADSGNVVIWLGANMAAEFNTETK